MQPSLHENIVEQVTAITCDFAMRIALLVDVCDSAAMVLLDGILGARPVAGVGQLYVILLADETAVCFNKVVDSLRGFERHCPQAHTYFLRSCEVLLHNPLHDNVSFLDVERDTEVSPTSAAAFLLGRQSLTPHLACGAERLFIDRDLTAAIAGSLDAELGEWREGHRRTLVTRLYRTHAGSGLRSAALAAMIHAARHSASTLKIVGDGILYLDREEDVEQVYTTLTRACAAAGCFFLPVVSLQVSDEALLDELLRRVNGSSLVILVLLSGVHCNGFRITPYLSPAEFDRAITLYTRVFPAAAEALSELRRDAANNTDMVCRSLFSISITVKQLQYVPVQQLLKDITSHIPSRRFANATILLHLFTKPQHISDLLRNKLRDAFLKLTRKPKVAKTTAATNAAKSLSACFVMGRLLYPVPVHDAFASCCYLQYLTKHNTSRVSLTAICAEALAFLCEDDAEAIAVVVPHARCALIDTLWCVEGRQSLLNVVVALIPVLQCVAAVGEAVRLCAVVANCLRLRSTDEDPQRLSICDSAMRMLAGMEDVHVHVHVHGSYNVTPWSVDHCSGLLAVLRDNTKSASNIAIIVEWIHAAVDCGHAQLKSKSSSLEGSSMLAVLTSLIDLLPMIHSCEHIEWLIACRKLARLIHCATHEQILHGSFRAYINSLTLDPKLLKRDKDNALIGDDDDTEAIPVAFPVVMKQLVSDLNAPDPFGASAAADADDVGDG